jgi:hypothetical protein
VHDGSTVYCHLITTTVLASRHDNTHTLGPFIFTVRSLQIGLPQIRSRFKIRTASFCGIVFNFIRTVIQQNHVPLKFFLNALTDFRVNWDFAELYGIFVPLASIPSIIVTGRTYELLVIHIQIVPVSIYYVTKRSLQEETLMMEAVCTFETSVNFYQTTRRKNQEDSHLHPEILFTSPIRLTVTN